MSGVLASPRAELCGQLVLPVDYAGAWRWVRGEIQDGALLLGGDYLAPAGEAIWISSLFGSHQVRAMVRGVLRWPAARLVVWRSDARAVARWGEEFGAVPVATDADGRRRWAVLRPGVVKFRERFSC